MTLEVPVLREGPWLRVVLFLEPLVDLQGLELQEVLGHLWGRKETSWRLEWIPLHMPPIHPYNHHSHKPTVSPTHPVDVDALETQGEQVPDTG